jgi:TonB family protein
MRCLTLLAFALIMLVSYQLSAQSLPIVERKFYDSLDNQTDSLHSFYYDKIATSFTPATGIKETRESVYTANGRKRVMIRYLANNGSYRTFFYPTGEAMAQAAFQFESISGQLKLLYRNGQQQAQLMFPAYDETPMDDVGYKIINYWDESGRQVVANGNGSGDFNFVAFPILLVSGSGEVVDGLKTGEWKGRTGDGTYVERYVNGVFMEGVSTLNGKQFKYTVIEEPFDVDLFYNYAMNGFRYPQSARLRALDGMVLVEFRIEKDGSLKNPRIAKGLSNDIDSEILRVMKKAPKFVPAKRRGLPVSTLAVLPINLKLE